jgi:hypothetical protein
MAEPPPEIKKTIRARSLLARSTSEQAARAASSLASFGSGWPPANSSQRSPKSETAFSERGMLLITPALNWLPIAASRAPAIP